MTLLLRSGLGLALATLAACGGPPTTISGGPGGLDDGSGDGDGESRGGDGDRQGPGALVSLNSCGTDNPAGLDEKKVKALLAGGAPGSMRFLYPYDGTVFPRGLA